MKQKASVVIVERLPLLCEALAHLLSDLGANVVGHSDTLVAGLNLLKTLSPDLAVLDRGAIARDLVEVIDTVREISPRTS